MANIDFVILGHFLNRVGVADKNTVEETIRGSLRNSSDNVDVLRPGHCHSFFASLLSNGYGALDELIRGMYGILSHMMSLRLILLQLLLSGEKADTGRSESLHFEFTGHRCHFAEECDKC